jgi:hypothetical protein
MAEYLPLYKPGESITCTASATITAGQLVAVSGDGTVGPAGAATAAWVGVAAFDAASGDKLLVHCGGVQRLVASGGVTAGAGVISGAAGTVASGLGTVGQQVGVALTTAADTALVEVLMVR